MQLKQQNKTETAHEGVEFVSIEFNEKTKTTNKS